jgi:hypothetical protein
MPQSEVEDMMGYGIDPDGGRDREYELPHNKPLYVSSEL